MSVKFKPSLILIMEGNENNAFRMFPIFCNVITKFCRISIVRGARYLHTVVEKLSLRKTYQAGGERQLQNCVLNCAPE